MLFSNLGSSASVERNFSNQARIHTKSRNKLVHARVEKLLAIQFNSNHKTGLIQERDIDCDDYLVYESDDECILYNTIENPCIIHL